MMAIWRVIPRNHRVAAAAWTMISSLLLAGCAGAPGPADDPPPTVRLDSATPPSRAPRTTPTHDATPESTTELSGAITIIPATITAETSQAAADPLTVAAAFVIAITEQYTDPDQKAQLADLATPELLAALQQASAPTGSLQHADVSATITNTELLTHTDNNGGADVRVTYTVKTIDTDHVRIITTGQAINLTLIPSGSGWLVSTITAAAG